MATITAERIRFLFSYDPTTGDFLWRNPTSHRIAQGERVGTQGANGRVYVGIDGTHQLAHRMVWLYVHGELPEGENISAKNGDYTDLRLENLGRQSFTETANKNRLRGTNTSGVRGVTWVKAKKKWRAELTKDYQKLFLGYFATLEDAKEAYNVALRNRASKPIDAEERRQLAQRKVLYALMRALWKRVLRENDGVVGWESFQAFCADVEGDIQPYTFLKSIREQEKIGPGNFQWVPTSEFDRTTTEGRNAYQKHYRAVNHLKAKNSDLKKAFGITLEEYEAMLKAQNDVCAICKGPEVEFRLGKLLSLAVDHCHASGKVRGLLCTACNVGIARFRDNPTAMRAAADYVELHAAKQNSVPASNVVHLKQKER